MGLSDWDLGFPTLYEYFKSSIINIVKTNVGRELLQKLYYYMVDLTTISIMYLDMQGSVSLMYLGGVR